MLKNKLILLQEWLRSGIVAFVEFVSFGRIRGQHYFRPFWPSLQWWYTGTKRFSHSGWICLSWQWYRRFRNV